MMRVQFYSSCSDSFSFKRRMAIWAIKIELRLKLIMICVTSTLWSHEVAAVLDNTKQHNSFWLFGFFEK